MDNFPKHLKRFEGNLGAINVVKIFNAVLGRDPTLTEVAKYRNYRSDFILDQVREIERKELGDKSEYSLNEFARSNGKEFGVSLVSTYNRQCGIATYTENLYTALRKNMRASVASDISRDRSDPSTEDGVVKCWSIGTAGYKYDLSKAIVEAKNSIIHVQHEWGLFKDNDYFMKTMRALKGYGFKTAATLHTVTDGRREKQLSQCFDVFIVHNEPTANFLYGKGINNVTVIPHGTEEPLDISPLASIEYVKTLIPLNPGDILVSYPGFISPNKLQLEVLKAVKVACQRLPNLKFLLIGSGGIGGYDGGLLMKLQEFQDDQIKVVQKFTSKEEMAKILIASDFCVQNYGATYFSTSGMSHFMMTYGVPTVSSHAKILGDLNSSMSLKVDGERPDRIAEAILRLAGDPSLRDQMGNAAVHEGVRTRWDKIAEMHKDVYYHIAENLKNTRRS